METKIFLMKVIIMLNILNLFGCGKKEEAYFCAPIYTGMRNHVFSIDPAQLQLQKNENSAVFAVLVETGYPEAVASLVTVSDGTVSLYFSNGGGIIGMGGHEKPRLAAKELLESSQNFVTTLAKTDSYPLPKKDHTRFYILTPEGVFTTEVKECVLGNGKHELSPLFYNAQAVITEIRVTQQSINSSHKD